MKSSVMSTCAWRCTIGKQYVIFSILGLLVHVFVACFSIIEVVQQCVLQVKQVEGLEGI